MLRGGEVVSVDDKGRMKIPARFVDLMRQASAGDDRRVFITSLDGSTVRVYPLRAWEAIEARLQTVAPTDEDAELFARTVNYWGRESQIDAAGRVLLPSLLRTHAKIDGEVHVAWSSDHLEVLDHVALAKSPPVVSREVRARLKGLGL